MIKKGETWGGDAPPGPEKRKNHVVEMNRRRSLRQAEACETASSQDSTRREETSLTKKKKKGLV